jgi:hypothetical protein
MSESKDKKKNIDSSMDYMHKVAMFFVMALVFAGVMIALDYALSYNSSLSPTVNYAKAVFAGVAIFGFAVYYFWRNNLSFMQIMGYLGTLLFLIGYIATRVANGVILPQAQALFGFSQTTLGYWNATFSLAYGLFQIPVGYFVNRFGLVVVGLLGLCAGGSAIGISLVSSVALVFLFRGLMGLFCAGASLGSDSVVVKLPVDYDEMYGYGSALATLAGIALSSAVSQISTTAGSAGSLFGSIHRYLGGGMIIGGVITLAAGIINSLRSSVTKIAKSEIVTKKTLPILQSLRDLCTLRHALSMVWAVCAVIFMYNTDVFNHIVAGRFPGSMPAFATRVGGLTGGVLALIIPLFSSTFPNAIEASFPIISGLNLLSFIGFVFGHHIAPWITGVFVALFTLTGCYHVMLFLILAKRRKGKGDAPFFFGVYNFFVMFFGCAIGQLLCSSILGRISGSLGVGARLGLAHFKTVALLFPFPIIAFITSFFIIKVPKKVEK